MRRQHREPQTTYGDMRGGLYHLPDTMYQVGASKILEAAHCIMGSLERMGRVQEPSWVHGDLPHIKEEMGIIEKVLGDRETINASHYAFIMKEGTPEFATAIQKIRSLKERVLKDTRKGRKEWGESDAPATMRMVALACYDLVDTLVKSMSSSLDAYPPLVLNFYLSWDVDFAMMRLRSMIDQLEGDIRNRMLWAPEAEYRMNPR